MKDPERILIVRMSHLGDVVCALPVFHALRSAFPDAAIGWAVQPEFAGLLTGLAGLQRTFLFERQGGLAAWLRMRRALRAFRPDVAVDAQGNWKSATATYASGAPVRLGLHPSEWREPLAARLINAPAPPSGEAHVAARGQALARFVTERYGVERYGAGGASDVRTDPGLRPAELEVGRRELDRLLPGGRPPAVLHLADPEDARAWPAERFASLARELGDAGRDVLCLSGPSEEDAGLAVARALGERAAPGRRHLVGQRDLRALAALFTAVAERGGTFVGVDSGPMHLACSVGLRALCLSGPQAPERTGPWDAAGARPDLALTASDPPDCAPCLARRCFHPDGPVCMERLSVAAVLRALAREPHASAH